MRDTNEINIYQMIFFLVIFPSIMLFMLNPSSPVSLLSAELVIIFLVLYAILIALQQTSRVYSVKSIRVIKCLVCKMNYKNEDEFLMHVCKDKIKI